MEVYLCLSGDPGNDTGGDQGWVGSGGTEERCGEAGVGKGEEADSAEAM